jgi:hypothetical protein
MLYARPKTNRNDFYCLRSELTNFVDLKEFDADEPPEGWYRYESSGTKIEASEGEVRALHVTVADGVVTREYLVISDEEAKKPKYHWPRVFSKLKAVSVLMKVGYWESCKKYIEDAGLYDLYLAANEFSEDNEHFVQGLEKIKSELGLSDDQVESLLSQMVKTY